ncbi:hypothetical protein [Alienimonas sp. DA493]|uniref:hypothetical protein n=1 Tax=Alienimonas sp. DA493 TaxID=3373605 RepID=UPI003754F659
MSRPADLFADPDDDRSGDDFADPFADDSVRGPSGAPVRASVGGRPMQPVLPADRVVYVPAPPNPWKGAALLLTGATLGLVTASVVWGVVFAVAWGAKAVEDAADAFEDLETAAVELDVDRVRAALAAEPAATEALGPLTAVTVNEDRTYADDTPWDVYYYDAVGERASGLLRVRYDDAGGFLDADLTLTDAGGENAAGEATDGAPPGGNAAGEGRTIELTLSDPD